MKSYGCSVKAIHARFLQKLVGQYNLRFIKTYFVYDKFYFDLDCENLTQANARSFWRKLSVFNELYF